MTDEERFQWIMGYPWDERTGPTEFLIGFVLIGYADDHYNCNPTISEISLSSKESEATVLKSLRILEKSGAILINTDNGDPYDYTFFTKICSLEDAFTWT